jgi:ArsR family transcriptional regulator, arsenate/arsenite/antimonite-responsive transcriptional repressor
MRLKHFSLNYGMQIFKSLSDESRVRILFLLFNNKELSTSDLEHILDFTQTKTARHLAYLKNAGLINAKKVDQWVFYYLKEEVGDILSKVFEYLNKDSTLVQDQETYRILSSNRELAKNKLEAKRWYS